MPLGRPMSHVRATSRSAGTLSIVNLLPHEGEPSIIRTMKTKDQLKAAIQGLDRKSYKAYRDLEGEWLFEDYSIILDHAQGDPFAQPSRLRAKLPSAFVGLDAATYSPPIRACGVETYLARAFADVAARESKRRGTGRSGEIRMVAPGQEVTAQTAVMIDNDGSIEVRFTVGLPARGRRIVASEALELLLEDVPAIIDLSLRASAHSFDHLLEAGLLNEDAEHLRKQLPDLGLIGFIADGAILPRASGDSDRPLRGTDVVPFESPPALRVELEAPNAGNIRGMGIPEGVTLIVGGGFHGKSTLLQALQWGVYNHRPKDGREFVVSDPGTVKIRAEDGRAVRGVDISPFIGNLPLGRSTEFFSTPNASGSTSQAAAIVEAVEVGSRVLLIDEDTAATNFMIRDRRMQELVPKDREPIIPFVDRVRQLYDQSGISTVLVIGGSGDYLDVADTVIAMDEYRPRHVTAQALSIATALKTGRISEAATAISPPRPRVPNPGSVDSREGRWKAGIKVRERGTIHFGRQTIDSSAVEQLVSVAQTRTVAAALLFARDRYMDGERSIAQILTEVESAIEREGLDALDERKVGHFAAFRRFELAAVLNRLRTLEVRP